MLKVSMPTRILAIFALPALAVLVGFLVLGLLWWPLALLSLPAAIATVWFFWYRSDEAILRSLNARQLGRSEGQRIQNMVENLCLTSGIAQPDLFIIDTTACNLISIRGRNSGLIATTGLLDQLDVMEMEGVVAHGLMKLTTGLLTYETLAASAGPFVTRAQRDLARRWGTGDASVSAFDISGVGLTKYPPGLRSALERLAGLPTEVEGAAALGAALLVPSAPHHAPLDNRIEVLWEL